MEYTCILPLKSLHRFLHFLNAVRQIRLFSRELWWLVRAHVYIAVTKKRIYENEAFNSQHVDI